MTHQPSASPEWDLFCNINQRRRAVRDFDETPLSDADVRAVLEAATLAPSSGNLQPYQLHWVRDPELKRRIADACDAQRSARSAATLVVVTASPRIALGTLAQQRQYIEHSADLDEKSRQYQRAQLSTFGKFLRIAPLFFCAPIRLFLSLVNPVHSLLPLGAAGMRNWAARSGIYAAQNLLLAATARGIDSCPMEGFSPSRVAKVLKLPRGHVIPIIIGLGHRRSDARIEPRWRRRLCDAVVEH